MSIALVFPGQGGQKVGSGKDLYDNFSYVKEFFNNANDIVGYNIVDIIFNGTDEQINATDVSQISIMLSSVATLMALENEYGFIPQQHSKYVAGHSLGEYSALVAAGVITPSQAIELLNVRGLAMKECVKNAKGTMIALIGGDIKAVEDLIKNLQTIMPDEIAVIANDNTKGQIVISGHIKPMEKTLEIYKDFGIKIAKKLNVSGAFHSPLMADASFKLADTLEEMDFKKPNIAFLPNVKADIEEDEQNIKNMLVKQVAGQVRWTETVEKLISLGADTFLEIGDSKVLQGLISRVSKDVATESFDKLEEFDKIKNFVK